MTHARLYQTGVRAYLAGLLLSGNPFHLADVAARDAWRDGWLDASHAYWRAHHVARPRGRHRP